MVIACHYLGRWADYYPYGDAYVPIGKYGYFGVQLFFVISGFVITLTLYRCASFYEFIVRRFARLWPTLVLCALLTYLFLTLSPVRVFPVSARDLIPALTFTTPETFNGMTRSDRYHWLDGSYWSLVVEVHFYVLIAATYFLQPRSFGRNLLYVSAALLGADVIALLLGFHSVAEHIEGTLIASFLPWFLIGIGFYFRSTGKPWVPFFALALCGLVIRMLANRSEALPLAIASVAIPAVMWASASTPLRRVLSTPLFTSIGASSYSLYLIHQDIGVTAIQWLRLSLGLHGPLSVVIALLMAGSMMVLAREIYLRFEMPLNRSIVSVLLSKARASAAVTAAPRSP
jgi:peptidoglycan/LPS O-acetylase OafA/YrhL